MGKVLGLHPLELQPGADAADLERLVRDDLAPLHQQIGQRVYLMKGDRGAQAGKYVLVIEIESVTERDRVFAVVDGEVQFPDDVATAMDQIYPVWKNIATLVVAFPSPEFTDYEVLD